VLNFVLPHEHHGDALHDPVDHAALVVDPACALSWHRPSPPR
jgi:hypothetical protein